MKLQKVINGFWLAGTAAIFTTQPAWADAVQVTAVQVRNTDSGLEVFLETPKNTLPPVLTSSYRGTIVANIINTQLRLKEGRTFYASNPSAGVVGVTVKPLNDKTVRVIVTGRKNVSIGKILSSDRGLVLSLLEKRTKREDVKPKKERVECCQISKKVRVYRSAAATNSKRVLKSKNKKAIPLQEFLKKRGLAEAKQKVGKKTTPSASRTDALPKRPFLIAQANAPIPTPATPAPATPPTAPAPTPPATSSPPPASNTDSKIVPNYLNPSGNPLQFPTKPEEVRIDLTQPITLQQAFDLARRNNLQLQAAQQSLERSRAALRQAQAALFPNLSVGAGVSNQGSDVFSNQFAESNEQTPPALRPPTSTTGLNGTVSLSYNLYTAGRRRASIRSAEEEVRVNQLEVERVREQLRLDVATNYYDLQQADEQVRIQQSAVTNAQASLRDAQALEQAGVGTRFDVLQQQVELANATQNLTDAISQQAIARRQLATTLSVAQSVSIVTAEPVAIAGLWNLSLEESIVLAFQNRAELEQFLANRNIAEQNRRIALASIRPQVNLSADYSARDTFDDSQDFGDGYTLGANFQLLLFDGGAARAQARQAEANIAIAETNFASQRNTIRLDVERAFSSLQANFANIQTASVALEQAREALRLARLRFQAGVGTQTDVINQQDALTQAEGNRVNAILGYNRALATLQRAISSGQPR